MFFCFASVLTLPKVFVTDLGRIVCRSCILCTGIQPNSGFMRDVFPDSIGYLQQCRGKGKRKKKKLTGAIWVIEMVCTTSTTGRVAIVFETTCTITRYIAFSVPVACNRIDTI